MRIQRSVMLLVAGLALAAAAPAFAAPAAAQPTPRTEDGHPDISGLWKIEVNTSVLGRAFGFESGGTTTTTNTTLNTVREGNMNYVEIDSEFIVKESQDMPMYKPEYWAEIRNNEEFGYRRPADPGYGCAPPGIVRLGSPTEIFLTPGKVTLIYTANLGETWVREVPLDGRPLPKPDDYEGLRPTGTSVGHWEGDTLVVETVDFPPDGQVWHSTRGWIGGADAKITERFRREGDHLVFDETVDDPHFIRPWVREPVALVVDKNPKSLLPTPLVCIERDGQYLPPSK